MQNSSDAPAAIPVGSGNGRPLSSNPRRRLVRLTGLAALIVVLGLIICVLVSIPGSPVRNFVQELGTEAGPIEKDHLRMSILLVVADNNAAMIFVLAENASDRHIVQFTDKSLHDWLLSGESYAAKLTDDFGNNYISPVMKSVGLAQLLRHRDNLRPGEFDIFPIACYAPVDKANYLHIELPSLALHSADKYHFKVRLKPEPLPPELASVRPRTVLGYDWQLIQPEKVDKTRILFKRDDYLKWLKRNEQQRRR